MVGKSERAERVAMQRTWSAAPAAHAVPAGSTVLRRKPRGRPRPSSVASPRADRATPASAVPEPVDGASAVPEAVEAASPLPDAPTGGASNRVAPGGTTRRVSPTLREPHNPAGAGFLRACLLLLVRERTGHGYELLSRLQRFGFDAADSGWLYRTLRRLEVDGLVSSSWETSGAGPARRIYQLTPRGEASLRYAADALRAEMHASQSFLDRYRRITQGGTRSSPPRPELLPDRAF